MSNFKKIRLGKDNEFRINTRGYNYEHIKDQFQLKVENKGLYDKVDIDNPCYNNNFGLFIKNTTIYKCGYRYVEYIGSKKSFQEAYEWALLKYGMDTFNPINLFIYNGYCYHLNNAFRNPVSRGIYKAMSDGGKYIYSGKKGAKRGSEKAESLTKKILGIRGY